MEEKDTILEIFIEASYNTDFDEDNAMFGMEEEEVIVEEELSKMMTIENKNKIWKNSLVKLNNIQSKKK